MRARTATRAARTAVIVDPFSTGADLAPEFRRRGWRTVAVLSSPELPAVYAGRLRSADFRCVLVHHGDVAATARALGDLSPDAVLAGTEIGVVLADALAEMLELPGNGTPASRCRRHKGEMARAVCSAGLAVPMAFEAASEAGAV